MIKEACVASLNVKGEEVKSNHVAHRLVNDPLTYFVVGVRVGVKGSTDLTGSREGSTTSWTKKRLDE